jgi:hypothetical protein
MRDPSRIPRICRDLQDLWEESPDQRLCQLIENILGCNRTQCIYQVEDDVFEVKLKEFEEKYPLQKKMEKNGT